MFVIGANSASTGYNLTRSLRFRASASAYLNRTPASATNRQIFTWSGWVKRGAIGGDQQLFYAAASSSDGSFIRFDSDNTLNVFDYTTVYVWRLQTTQVFRDPSAWYHIVVAVDTTQATAANRVKIYVNGVQVTALATASYPTQNTNTNFNNTVVHAIGRNTFFGNYFDGYQTELNWVDGSQLTPSSFGSTNALTGVWQPAAYTGSYGTNGFELQFTDNSAATAAAIGKDSSGNGNNWTPNNISVTAGVTYDSMTDVPTLTSATASNFAVGNPLQTGGTTWSGGNLNFSLPSGTGNGQASIAVTTGKWYWEMLYSAQANDTGVQQRGVTSRRTNAITYAADGSKYVNGTNSAYGATYTTGDVISVALDMDGGTVTFYKNNASQGSISLSGAGITEATATITAGGGLTTTGSFNFGQRPFTYTAPSGYVALNTYNLPTSTIVKGNTVMDVNLWAGTGATNVITNTAGFKPDLVWGKSRSNAYNHVLVDSVRGANIALASNATAAEVVQTQGVMSFNSNGFTLGTSADSSINNAGSGQTYVGWQWQAGQGTTSSNTSGTITSTVSVNASAGFSVVTYTGTGGASATVGHGLGVAPSLIIVKERGSNVSGWNAWTVYHSSIGATGNLVLNTTAATNTAVYGWNNTAPTSSVFTIAYSAGAGVNYTSTYVAYCWTPIAGYSAFGSYTGNGSADGPFVYTGFRPKFIMIKRSDTAGNYWRIWDTARAPYNAGLPALYPNTSDAEDSISDVYDLLSNGFKLRTSAAGTNASSSTYIYMAFAETPFKNSLGR